MNSTTAVLLIAHGSRQHSANEDLRTLAARLRDEGLHAIVEASFLELADPNILQAGIRCAELGANLVLMIPYFLSAGVHLQRDLTAARLELSALYPEITFRLGPPLGPDPLLDQIVKQRVADLEQAES